MENASKALLISAAVLIVLLLIGMGIKTIDSTSELREQVDTSTQTAAVSSFNSQFTQYFSNSASAAETRSFIQKLISHNATISNSGTFSAKQHQIYLNFYRNGIKISKDGHSRHQWKSDQLYYLYNEVNDNKRYIITMSNDCTSYSGGYNNGYIICISIKEK